MHTFQTLMRKDLLQRMRRHTRPLGFLERYEVGSEDQLVSRLLTNFRLVDVWDREYC